MRILWQECGSKTYGDERGGSKVGGLGGSIGYGVWWISSAVRSESECIAFWTVGRV